MTGNEKRVRIILYIHPFQILQTLLLSLEEQKHLADCCCICCGNHIPDQKKSLTDYVTAEELAGLDYRWRLTPLHNHQIENFKLMKSCSLVRNKPLNKAWRTFMDHLEDKRYPIILSSKK